MLAGHWDEMSIKKQAKFKKLLQCKANRFYHLTKNRYKISKNVFVQLLRRVFKGMINSYADTQPDKIFWKAKGWIK